VSISDIFWTKPRARAGLRNTTGSAALPTLPDIAPGQLWLVEAPAADGAPSAPVRHAIDGANVVIYDRALARHLVLPLGTYAEPAPEADRSGAAAAQRCVRFARDGWSVVRLLPSRLPSRERTAEVRDFVAELAAAKVPGGLRVTVVAEGADGIAERTETSLDRLGATVATYGRDTTLAIVIDAFAGRGAAPAIVANGLAG
jgi:hypothetical protein